MKSPKLDTTGKFHFVKIDVVGSRLASNEGKISPVKYQKMKIEKILIIAKKCNGQNN
nr:MAG TPA: hypothetical protein [Caudoviricetes sp.]